MVNYSLYVGLILCFLGILMRARKLDFLMARYEFFQMAIRKKNLSVDRERLSKFYSYFFIILGGILLIAAIIQFIIPEMSKGITFWIFIVVAAVGIIGILYCNLTNRYLKYDSNDIHSI